MLCVLTLITPPIHFVLILIVRLIHCYDVLIFIIIPLGKSSSSLPNNSLFSLVIREYGSTLYVGLARAVSPTNTNFRLTFLLTQLQEALYKDLAV